MRLTPGLCNDRRAHYVGHDVSLKLTAICIVDRTGKIEPEGVVRSDPEAIAAFIISSAPHVARIGLEAGATSTWLWTELTKLGRTLRFASRLTPSVSSARRLASICVGRPRVASRGRCRNEWSTAS